MALRARRGITFDPLALSSTLSSDGGSSNNSSPTRLTDSGKFIIGGIEISKEGVVEAPLHASFVHATAAAAAAADASPAEAATVDSTVAPAKGSTASGGATSSSATAPPPPPSIDFSELQLLQVVGRGASGFVRRAVHLPTGRKVAIKEICISDPARRQQILQEIQTLRATTQSASSFLMQYEGVRFTEGSIQICMALMDAGSLGDLVARHGPLPPAALATITHQVLGALVELRGRRLVHRDLKPQNILLNLRGEARVSDFGCVAELQDSFGKCGTFVGTVPYMSPERIQGQSYSYASDIWALGLTLHECAVGHFPYARRQGYWGILQAMIKEPSPSLSTEEGHPPTLCDFVDQCLRKDPNLRPAAKELQAHAFVGEGSSGFDLPGYLRRVLGESVKGSPSGESGSNAPYAGQSDGSARAATTSTAPAPLVAREAATTVEADAVGLTGDELSSASGDDDEAEEVPEVSEFEDSLAAVEVADEDGLLEAEDAPSVPTGAASSARHVGAHACAGDGADGPRTAHDRLTARPSSQSSQSSQSSRGSQSSRDSQRSEFWEGSRHQRGLAAAAAFAAAEAAAVTAAENAAASASTSVDATGNAAAVTPVGTAGTAGSAGAAAGSAKMASEDPAPVKALVMRNAHLEEEIASLRTELQAALHERRSLAQQNLKSQELIGQLEARLAAVRPSTHAASGSHAPPLPQLHGTPRSIQSAAPTFNRREMPAASHSGLGGRSSTLGGMGTVGEEEPLVLALDSRRLDRLHPADLDRLQSVAEANVAALRAARRRRPNFLSRGKGALGPHAPPIAANAGGGGGGYAAPPPAPALLPPPAPPAPGSIRAPAPGSMSSRLRPPSDRRSLGQAGRGPIAVRASVGW